MSDVSASDVARPLVSIVTPCLNPGRRLRRCIESVASQTYSNVEHIVVDGGSTDDTLEELKSWDHVIWISEPDQGQSDALIKGFQASRGTLLTWLNADDVLHPRAVEAAVSVVTEDPDVGLVYGDLEIVEGGARKLWKPLPKFDHSAFDDQTPIAQPGTFFSRDVYSQVGGVDKNLHLCMDLDLWLKMVDAEVRAHYIAEPLAIFEIHGSSKTGGLDSGEFMLEASTVYLRRNRPTEAREVLLSYATRRIQADIDQALRENRLSDAKAQAKEGLALLVPGVSSRHRRTFRSWFLTYSAPKLSRWRRKAAT